MGKQVIVIHSSIRIVVTIVLVAIKMLLTITW